MRTSFLLFRQFWWVRRLSLGDRMRFYGRCGGLRGLGWCCVVVDWVLNRGAGHSFILAVLDGGIFYQMCGMSVTIPRYGIE